MLYFLLVSQFEAEAQSLRVAILDDYLGIALGMAPWQSIPGAEVTAFSDHVADPDALVERLKPFDVVCAMRERTPLPRAVIERLPELRLIVTTGLYNASIDVKAASEAGVVVSGTQSGVEPTVELAWALILAAARHTAANDRGMRAGEWQRTLGVTLSGRRLGVLGLGRNGSRVAEIGKAFGMDVVAWSQNLTPERAAEVGVGLVTKEVLLESSDVVTIHLRLSDRTHALIDDDAIARMRPTAILVNTSRGQIVDEAALLTALREGRLAGAALDVYDDEPLPADHPLRSLENVVLSPHVGYVTRENMGLFYRQTVEDILAFQAGTPLRIVQPR